MQTFFLSLKKLGEILLRQIIFRFVFASIAQLAEHAPRKRKVASSILAGGYLNRYKGRWSRGMILRSGRRGRGFDSRTAPSLLVFIFIFCIERLFFPLMTIRGSFRNVLHGKYAM